MTWAEPRIGYRRAAADRGPTLIIGIKSDVLTDCRTGIPAPADTGAELISIASDFGHDGFLLEYDKIEPALKEFIDDGSVNHLKAVSAWDLNRMNMETHKQLTVDYSGFGVVGEGLYRILQQTLRSKHRSNGFYQSIPTKNAMPRLRCLRPIRTTCSSTQRSMLIVEVIDDSKAAFEIVSTALNQSKDVVSASKKMIAENLAALLELQSTTGRSLLYEAATCASIPVIRNPKNITTMTCCILIRDCKRLDQFHPSPRCLREHLISKASCSPAQQKAGFAESNPRLDVEGFLTGEQMDPLR